MGVQGEISGRRIDSPAAKILTGLGIAKTIFNLSLCVYLSQAFETYPPAYDLLPVKAKIPPYNLSSLCHAHNA